MRENKENDAKILTLMGEVCISVLENFPSVFKGLNSTPIIQVKMLTATNLQGTQGLFYHPLR